MIPDRLPEALRALIAKFPAGALQFEVGVQSLNPDVEKLISRRQDHSRLADNLRWLRSETGVHVHADLIVGLPGEDLESFGRGFDALWRMRPQEIQVGILKRLRGTPIVRHDAEWEMVYSPHPPYEILQTKLVSFDQLQSMRRFSRYWDMIANSGKFGRTIDLLLAGPSPFERFLHFSVWLYERTGQRTHGIALHELTEAVSAYLLEQLAVDSSEVLAATQHDRRPRGKDLPKRQGQHAVVGMP